MYHLNICCILDLIVEPLVDEQFSEAKHVRRITFAELYDLVADIVSSLLACGLKPGDRVGSYSSNCIVRLSADHFMNRLIHH